MIGTVGGVITDSPEEFEHAAEHDTIFVSAGRLGMSLEIGVDDLLRAANAKLDDIADNE